MSAVIPDEEVFYMASFLWTAVDNNTKALMDANNQVVKVCEEYNLGCKMYLPHFTSQEGWKKHFGNKWDRFVSRKRKYDPIAILSPGHKIFTPLQLV
jgi:cytokinin dehydrogenase